MIFGSEFLREAADANAALQQQARQFAQAEREAQKYRDMEADEIGKVIERMEAAARAIKGDQADIGKRFVLMAIVRAANEACMHLLRDLEGSDD